MRYDRMEYKNAEDIYRRYMNELYHYLLQLSGHPQTAEDLVQDTFIKAYTYLDSYDEITIRSWLFKVARNAYIDWYRREKKQVPTDPLDLSAANTGTSISPESHYLILEDINRWLHAVYALPKPYKEVILLRDYYSFSYEEISSVLQISNANVKVRLFRARQKINEVIQDGL